MTWNNATNDVMWENLDLDTKFYHPDALDTVFTVGGCDFGPECKAIANYVSINEWEHYDITETMKTIIKNQETFHGFMIKEFICPKGDSTTTRILMNTGKFYSSSEDDSIDLRPKLTIIYNSTGINTSYLIKNDNYGVLFRNTAGIPTLYIPLERNYKVSIYNMKGRQVHSFRGIGKKWYYLPSILRSGMHVISIKTSINSYSRKILLTK